jgi:hypothetical protein
MTWGYFRNFQVTFCNREKTKRRSEKNQAERKSSGHIACLRTLVLKCFAKNILQNIKIFRIGIRLWCFNDRPQKKFTIYLHIKRANRHPRKRPCDAEISRIKALDLKVCKKDPSNMYRMESEKEWDKCCFKTY